MATNKDKAATKKTSINKKDILQSNDKKIDDDFPGFPSNPSKQNMINPETKTDKLVSGTDKKMERKTGKPILKQEHTTSKTKKKKLIAATKTFTLVPVALLKEQKMCAINNIF